MTIGNSPSDDSPDRTCLAGIGCVPVAAASGGREALGGRVSASHRSDRRIARPPGQGIGNPSDGDGLRMRRSGRRLMWVLHLAVAMSFVGAARAEQAAVAFDTSQYWSLGGGSGTYGWQFATQSEIEISSLGIYDDAGVSYGFPGNGLLESHEIGIWDVADPSAPLASATIPAGTVAPLVDGFRYVDISPVMLSPGHEYVIAAVYSSQDIFTSEYFTGFNNNPSFDLTLGPGIDIQGYRYHIPSEFVFPDNYFPGLQSAPFGPNFTYASVPEPSGLTLGALAIIAFSGWGLSRLRRPVPERRGHA
jgi:hypothetical protein